MQEQILAQPEQSHPSPVKSLINLKLFWLTTIFMGIGCVSYWLAAILSIFTGHISLSIFIQSIFTTILLVCHNRGLYYSFKLFEQKRLAAVQGDQRLLADEQPVPNAQALPLPISISMRPRKSLLIAFSAIVLLVLLLVVLFALLLFSHAITASGQFYWISIFLIVIAAVLLSALPVFLVLYGNGRKQITLTEYGILHIDRSPKIQSIPWCEVRLFASYSPILSASGQVQNQPPVFFELASAQAVIRWNWLRRKTSFFYQPSTSPAEYEQQMRAMLSVIRAKTGLPLYDLRKKI